MAAAKMALGDQECLYLGNMDAKRDWGHAKDYVEGMRLMLQQDKPEDFVLATGVTTTVREFVIASFKIVGVDLEFRNEGIQEIGVVAASDNPDYNFKVGDEVIKIDPKYYRPTEVDLLIGDPSKANNLLGWIPKYDLNSLVCLLYTSPSPRDATLSRMPSSA